MADKLNLSRLPSMVQTELNHLMLGEHLGSGISRHVFVLKHEPKLVAKIEPDDTQYFCNVIEWDVWKSVKDHPEVAKWFAPCEDISMCGSVLLQARTKPIKKMPDKVPSFLSDCHLGNFGIYKGRPVVHDYGFHRMLERGFKRYRMVSPKNL
jgi:hypothetical protein